MLRGETARRPRPTMGAPLQVPCVHMLQICHLISLEPASICDCGTSAVARTTRLGGDATLEPFLQVDVREAARSRRASAISAKHIQVHFGNRRQEVTVVLYIRVVSRLRRLLFALRRAPGGNAGDRGPSSGGVPGGSRKHLSLGADSVPALVDRSGGSDQRYRRPLQPARPDRRGLQDDRRSTRTRSTSSSPRTTTCGRSTTPTRPLTTSRSFRTRGRSTRTSQVT